MATQGPAIAIVDDDLELRGCLVSLLAGLGYRTEEYGSAEEFIGAAALSEASCLLVDIQLGDISGVELGCHLSATGFTFPIIFMTGSRDETYRRQAFDLGCVAYLEKPFSVKQLTDAITMALRSAPL